jgi:hypothetical protein
LELMRRVRDSWRRARRRRPAATALGVLAIGSIAVGGGLAAAGLVLLAQLVGGLSLVPLSMAAYLCLLPVGWWPGDEGGGGGPGGGGRDGGGPSSPGGPGADLDWARFEAEFWAYVDEHQLVQA